MARFWLAIGVLTFATVVADVCRCASPSATLGEDHPVSASASTGQDWIDLFNGRDLSGWERLGGGVAKVADGVLVLQNDEERKPGYLVSQMRARDFAVEFRCRIFGGDSGLFYRCSRDPRTPDTIIGPQVQLNAAPGRSLGGIYETQGRGWVRRIPDALNAETLRGLAWFEGSVKVKGDHVQVILNGRPLVDFKDSSPENRFRDTGHFALQIHGGSPCEVHFSRLRVRVLD